MGCPKGRTCTHMHTHCEHHLCYPFKSTSFTISSALTPLTTPTTPTSATTLKNYTTPTVHTPGHNLQDGCILANVVDTYLKEIVGGKGGGEGERSEDMVWRMPLSFSGLYGNEV